MKHTPGPWKAIPPDEYSKSWRIFRCNSPYQVVRLQAPKNFNIESDARLIAAAPDMKKELELIIVGWEAREGDNWRRNRIEPLNPWEQERLNYAREIIDKATTNG